MSSVPPHFNAQRTAEAVEDCRDYLRTGRCKYGASCKYNHPPNVQSGGGMKAPIDPSEPMFPIRPNERVCQYYMKHGTCKFGQACKFHHPPQTSLPAGVSSGAIMMNVGRKSEPPQLLLNPLGTDPTGASMMVQLLPQRPNEADCIYFLKNGRCKYGATCRYHHPINYHQRKQEERRQHAASQDAFPGQKVQYITQTAGIPAGHVILADGHPYTLVGVEGGGGAAGLQPVSIVSNEGLQYSIAPEQGSSASSTSIASSYDTASSTYEPLTGAGDAGLWNRARRNGSGGSLNAFANVEVQPVGVRSRSQTRAGFPHSASDGNISARRHRASSYGSAAEHQAFFDSPNGGRGLGSWREERHDPNSYFEATRHGLTRLVARPDLYEMPDLRGPHRTRPPPVTENGHVQLRRSPRARNQRRRESDEGFTMMTSALLNMLDTPEEASAESYSDDEIHRCYPVDPSMMERLMISEDRDGVMRQQVIPEGWAPPPQSSSRPSSAEGIDHNYTVARPKHYEDPTGSAHREPESGNYFP